MRNIDIEINNDKLNATPKIINKFIKETEIHKRSEKLYKGKVYLQRFLFMICSLYH